MSVSLRDGPVLRVWPVNAQAPRRKLPDHSSRSTAPELPRRHVRRHDCARCHHRAVSERDPRADDGSREHRNEPSGCDFAKAQRRSDRLRHSCREVLGGREDHRAGAAFESLAQLDLASPPQNAVGSDDGYRPDLDATASFRPLQPAAMQDRAALNGHTLSEMQEVWTRHGDVLAEARLGEPLLQPTVGLKLRVHLPQAPPVVSRPLLRFAHGHARSRRRGGRFTRTRARG